MSYEEWTQKDLADYHTLCDKVGKFSKTAKEYLEKEAIDLPDFDPDYNLAASFNWRETEQGWYFWDLIDTLLRQEEYDDKIT